MEIMPMDMTALRTAARKITFIPEHYRLVMEDNTPKGFNERARTFIWEDPQLKDHKIEVSLSLKTGQLMRLEIEQESHESMEEAVAIEQAKKAAKAFMSKFHPDYKVLTSLHAEFKRNRYDVEIRAEVGGLPLPNTGCEVRLDQNLNVVRYQADEYTGVELPGWPSEIVTPEAAKERIIQDIHMGLIITTLYPSVYELEGNEEQHRLVYEPAQGRRKIDAVTGEPLFALQHDLLPPTVPIPPAHDEIQQPSKETEGALLEAMAHSNPETENMSLDGYTSLIRFWEAQLGIDTARYVLDRPRGDEENLILYYFEKNLANNEAGADQESCPTTDPLSVDGYMERRWGDALRNFDAAYMVHIDKSTGHLERLHYKQRSPEGEAVLTREQCWRVAERFLQRFFPEYAAYLQLEVEWDEEESEADQELEEEQGAAEPRKRENFHLPLFVDQYRVRTERVHISVSTITGEVLIYRSVSKERILELEACRFESMVSPEEALARYADHLEVSLRWFIDGDDNTSCYKLIYDPVYKRRAELEGTTEEHILEFIDAVNGEPVWMKM
ncbi:DUF4901 domain-containing protein [Paenibacillus sp. Cedars]|nr:DUF4901 domain-containing protein [Paenibacillus sp. Cedars]